MSAGIDYGLGRTNIDRETGIRYGVISQNSVMQAWFDSAEPDYGKATCPKCGNGAKDCANINTIVKDEFEHLGGCADYTCENCEITFDSSEAFPDEAQSWNYDDEGYQLTDCLDSDIFVLKSPYYTPAQFCSPCIPGAGNLDSHDTEGIKTYCLGHDWFEEGKAPYPVYRVDNDELVSDTDSKIKALRNAL